ncbi:MAG TPA: hypothetical protein VGM33_12785 [Baekduia sp.]
MRNLKRIGFVAVAVAVLAPASADAATSARTPPATVRAYVAALGRHDARGACALVDPSVSRSQGACRTSLETDVKILRARIEPGALTRGTRARVVVGLVVDDGAGAPNVPPRVSRTRLLLHRIDGRWRIVAAGAPIALGTSRPGSAAPDPAPAGTEAALRRLADDELLALSGNATMLCDLLARGAPLAGRDGGCVRVALGGLDAAGLAVRLARFTVHRTAPGRARLDVTAVATRAVHSARRPGYALRSRRWSDVVFAVRSGGRWALAKPSRSFYRALRLPAPADVGSPSATATWPDSDAAVPSLSERSAPPGCRTPLGLWALTCFSVDGLASGAGLVAWSAGYAASARPVAAGAAAGPTTTVATLDRQDERLWSVTGIAPVGDGALVIETGFGNLETRAIPIGRDGRPRGPVLLVAAGVTDGKFDNDVGGGSVVVPMPAGSATATVVTATRRIVRLGADGRPAGPGGMLANGLELGDGLLVGRSDGTLVWFRGGDGGDGIAVTALDASGSAVGAPVTQPTDAVALGPSFAAAEDAAGRVLVGWIDERADGRRTLRTWAYDPDAPGSTAPVPRAAWPAAGPGGDVTDDADLTDAVDVSALPDGGWGLAWSVGSGLWAGRLLPTGAWLAEPRLAAAAFLRTSLDARGFGLAGDTVAWIAPPAVAGVSQVRSSPLP